MLNFCWRIWTIYLPQRTFNSLTLYSGMKIRLTCRSASWGAAVIGNKHSQQITESSEYWIHTANTGGPPLTRKSLCNTVSTTTDITDYNEFLILNTNHTSHQYLTNVLTDSYPQLRPNHNPMGKFFHWICSKFYKFKHGHNFFWPQRSWRLLEAKNTP